MSAFPTTTVPVSDVDEGGDKPKLARTAFLTAFNLLNAIINSLNQINGVCGLDATAKVPSTNLGGAVDNPALQDDAVNGRTVEAGQINFTHFKATITNDPAAPTGGTDGDMHFIYE